jgi:hypothetical protein
LVSVTVARSILLIVLAALAEIGGAWLVWQGVREHRGLLWIGAAVLALGVYGFVATLQPDVHFGRILAAYAVSSSPPRCCGVCCSTDSARTVTTSSAPSCACSASP